MIDIRFCFIRYLIIIYKEIYLHTNNVVEYIFKEISNHNVQNPLNTQDNSKCSNCNLL